MLFKFLIPNIRLSFGHHLEQRASPLSWRDQMVIQWVVQPLSHCQFPDTQHRRQGLIQSIWGGATASVFFKKLLR